MSTEIATVEKPGHLVALTPEDVPKAQAALDQWCHAKMRELGAEFLELNTNLSIAKKNKWRHSAIANAVNRTRRRIQYYRKIQSAVRAGYLIIPNFPIETIAVRVSRDAKPQETGRWASDVNTAQPELLPQGEGRYVDEVTFTHDASYPDEENGQEIIVHRRQSGDYDDTVDFPVIGIKPIIMEATSRAMALKLFDRIGIANHSGRTTSSAQRRADPIVIGQIVDPINKGRWNEHVVSFFVAWWLDPRTL